MLSLFVLVLQLLSILRIGADISISKPNCTNHCGKVKIPYPFGIGANCYHDSSYEIICNASFESAKPFLRQYDLEVVEINWQRRYPQRTFFDPVYSQTITIAQSPLKLCASDGGKKIHSLDLNDSPYQFSQEYNILMMEGCGGSAVLRNGSGRIMAGCSSVCDSEAANVHVGETICYGVGCCQASVNSINSIDYYEISVSFEPLVMKSNSCDASVALVDTEKMQGFNVSGPLSSLDTIPTTLHWETKWVTDIYTSDDVNVTCSEQTCQCGEHYDGNPYLPYGCQVLEGCENCATDCQTEYYSGTRHNYCARNSFLRRAPFLGFVIGTGVIVLFLSSYWLYKTLKRRKQIKRKAKNFKRNGGLLLQQQMSSDKGVVEATKVFSVTELQKATDNFNENRILGKGAQGTVYKGMLLDGKIVAIKKSMKVDESQVEQFVNEVVILSQINHRNVVKLSGCCLETEVPILVYEFIPNGTLYEHIHGESEEFHVTWKMRLQIAAESAGAVAYLHSSSSAPIYHRDIKSTNILLDEKYRAKVSDFGTSKAITIEQTHVTTAVLGTYGYMDPEYFQSNQFTEKSDVYSFGVVLVELITGKKPICPTGNGGWINLANEFLNQMKDSHLLDMIDSRIIEEGKEEEFMVVAKLAKRCLNMNGKRRPTMKEIAVQLEGIRSSNIPIVTDLSPAESDDDLTELIYADKSPLGETMYYSLENPPRPFSIETKPLMGHDS